MGDPSVAISKTLYTLRNGRHHPEFQDALKDFHSTYYRCILSQLIPFLHHQAEEILGEFFLKFLTEERYLCLPEDKHNAEKWFFAEVTNFLMSRLDHSIH